MWLLGANSRVAAVAGVDDSVVWQGEQTGANAFDDLGAAAGIASRVPGTTGEQRVTGKQVLADQETGAARRVAGCVQRLDFVLTEPKCVALVNHEIRGRLEHAGVVSADPAGHPQ